MITKLINKSVNVCWHFVSCSLKRRIHQFRFTHYVQSISKTRIDLDEIRLWNIQFDHDLVNQAFKGPLCVRKAQIESATCHLLPWNFSVYKSLIVLSTCDDTCVDTCIETCLDTSTDTPRSNDTIDPDYTETQSVSDTHLVNDHPSGALGELINIITSMVQNLIHSISVTFEDTIILFKVPDYLSDKIQAVLINIDKIKLAVQQIPVDQTSSLISKVEGLVIQVIPRRNNKPITVLTTTQPTTQQTTQPPPALEFNVSSDNKASMSVPSLTMICGLDMGRTLLSLIKSLSTHTPQPQTPYQDLTPIVNETPPSFSNDQTDSSTESNESVSTSSSRSTDVLGWFKRMLSRLSGMQLSDLQLSDNQSQGKENIDNVLEHEYMELKTMFDDPHSTNSNLQQGIDDHEKDILLNLMQSTSDLKQFILDDLEDKTPNDLRGFVDSLIQTWTDHNHKSSLCKLQALMDLMRQMTLSIAIQVDHFSLLIPEMDTCLERTLNDTLSVHAAGDRLFQISAHNFRLCVANEFAAQLSSLMIVSSTKDENNWTSLPILQMGAQPVGAQAVIDLDHNLLSPYVLYEAESDDNDFNVTFSLQDNLMTSAISSPSVYLCVTHDLVDFCISNLKANCGSKVDDTQVLTTEVELPEVEQVLECDESGVSVCALSNVCLSIKGVLSLTLTKDDKHVQMMLYNVDVSYDTHHLHCNGEIACVIKLADTIHPIFVTSSSLTCLRNVLTQSLPMSDGPNLNFTLTQDYNCQISVKQLGIWLPLNCMEELIPLIPTQFERSEQPPEPSIEDIPTMETISEDDMLIGSRDIATNKIISDLKLNLDVCKCWIIIFLSPDITLISNLDYLTLNVTDIFELKLNKLKIQCQDGPDLKNLVDTCCVTGTDTCGTGTDTVEPCIVIEGDDLWTLTSVAINNLDIICETSMVAIAYYLMSRMPGDTGHTETPSLTFSNVKCSIDAGKFPSEFRAFLAEAGLTDFTDQDGLEDIYVINIESFQFDEIICDLNVELRRQTCNHPILKMTHLDFSEMPHQMKIDKIEMSINPQGLKSSMHIANALNELINSKLTDGLTILDLFNRPCVGTFAHTYVDPCAHTCVDPCVNDSNTCVTNDPMSVVRMNESQFFSPLGDATMVEPLDVVDSDVAWEEDPFYSELARELGYDIRWTGSVSCLVPPCPKQVSWQPKFRLECKSANVNLLLDESAFLSVQCHNLSVILSTETRDCEITPLKTVQGSVMELQREPSVCWKVCVDSFWIRDMVETSSYEYLCQSLGGSPGVDFEIRLNPVSLNEDMQRTDGEFHLVPCADPEIITKQTRGIEHSVHLTLPSVWVTLDMTLATRCQEFSDQLEDTPRDTVPLTFPPSLKLIATLIGTKSDGTSDDVIATPRRRRWHGGLTDVGDSLPSHSNQTVSNAHTVPLVRSFRCEPLLLRFDFMPGDIDTCDMQGPLQALNFLAHICPVEGFEVPFRALKVDGLMTPTELVARVLKASTASLTGAQLLKYAMRGTPLMRSLWDISIAFREFISKSIDTDTQSTVEQLVTLRKYREVFDEEEMELNSDSVGTEELPSFGDEEAGFVDAQEELAQKDKLDAVVAVARRLVIWAEYQAVSTLKILLGHANESAPTMRRVAMNSAGFLKCLATESLKVSERVVTSCSRKVNALDDRVNGPQTLHRAATADGPLWSLVERGSADFYEPATTLEGLSDAFVHIGRGWRSVSVTHDTRLATSLLSLEAVHTIRKVLPLLLLKPIVTLTGAASSALQGVVNQFEPRRRLEKERVLRAPRVVN